MTRDEMSEVAMYYYAEIQKRYPELKDHDYDKMMRCFRRITYYIVLGDETGCFDEIEYLKSLLGG